MSDNIDSTRTVNVLYFAAASTATNLTEERVGLPDNRPFPLSSLAALLAARHPNTGLVKVLENSQWSVDAEMVDNPETMVLNGDRFTHSSTCILSVYPTSSEMRLDAPARSSAFQATRLTSNTYMLKEHNDIYSEHPFIYVKVVPSSNTVVVVDTGCGGASNDPDTQITSLREFIETVELYENEGKPLNEGGKMHYVVVTTHCHYDHILGVEQFSKDSPILASSYDRLFLSPSALPEHSLCNALGLPTPSYTPTLVPDRDTVPGSDVMIVMHTPGHTPDELALYDAEERMLYVGDSLYEHEEIIFPKEGSIVAWFASIDTLISFVRFQDKMVDREGQVLLNAGHCTVAQPALEVLEAAKAFMQDIVEGKEYVKKRLVVRGEKNVGYRQKNGRFSLRCPERLVEEARMHRAHL